MRPKKAHLCGDTDTCLEFKVWQGVFQWVLSRETSDLWYIKWHAHTGWNEFPHSLTSSYGSRADKTGFRFFFPLSFFRAFTQIHIHNQYKTMSHRSFYYIKIELLHLAANCELRKVVWKRKLLHLNVRANSKVVFKGHFRKWSAWNKRTSTEWKRDVNWTLNSK